MNRKNDGSNEIEKSRIRSEIDAQIAKYLEAGGRIDVVSARASASKAAIGSVWHSPDDIPGFKP